MQIQEESSLPQALSLLLRNKESRTRMIKSLFEALSTLNLPASVRALEKQSRLLMQDQRIRIIRSHLRSFQYELACEQVMQLQLPTRLRQEVVRDLKDLQLDYWLSSGQEEVALAHLYKSQVTETRRLQVCEMIALGTCDITIEQIEHCHQLILQRCEQETKDQSNVRKALADYFGSPTNSSVKCLNPPNALTAESQAITVGRKKVNFVKLNPSGERIAMLIEGEVELILTVYRISGHLIKREYTMIGDGLGWATQMKWSNFQQPDRQLIGLCSYDKLMVIDAAEELRVVLTLNRQTLAAGKFLCFQWHPISEILYLGGLFQKIMGFDSGGELTTEVNPYCKIRELVFSPTGKLFTIGATKQGQLLKYCLEEERIQAKFSATSLFMDLKYQSGLLLATTKQYIYVIDADSMTVLNLIVSPPNEKLFKIQAFLCDSWVIIFNQTLRGVRQHGSALLQSKWHNCEAVDVNKGKMLTFHTSLRVWEGNAAPVQHKSNEMENQFNNPQRPSLPHSPSLSSSSSSSSFTSSQDEMEVQQDGISEECEYQYEEMIELPLGQPQEQSLI